MLAFNPMLAPAPNHPHAPFDLAAAARSEMIREGFHVFPTDSSDAPGGDDQLAQIRTALTHPPAGLKDLRQFLWSSIDNDTSRDLDQIEYAEQTSDGTGIRVLVAIADVSAAVLKDTPLDLAAEAQSQTVYTAVHNFPMLPTLLSTDLTSLNESQDRPAIVIEFTVDATGIPTNQSIYPALVRNQAQLAYSTTGPWLENKPRADGRHEPKLETNPALAANLRLQDQAAQRLHTQRIAMGALDFNRVEADPVVIDGKVQAIQAVIENRASTLIADFMIAANETMAATLRKSGRSSIRRVVRSPERWGRIVTLVASKGTQLPAEPDSAALNVFLQAQRQSDPIHYPDLSLAIIKLMGPGEYVLAAAGSDDQPGHFGLAALDYTHSTAPNRRFADLVTQRVLKAMLANQPAPYTDDELAAIAQHLNERDSAARKVERTMQKRVAAVALAADIGKHYQGVITGANDKGTFIRIFNPPVEGKIVHGAEGLDVGDTTSVTLANADPVHAFIDFTRP
jgi:VacB/RNase II family 3'-5' exoribonuclease